MSFEIRLERTVTGTAQKILVTGAAGRLGGRVVECLTQAGLFVLPTDRLEGEAGGIPIQTCELEDREGLTSLLDKVSGVVHCAAQPGFLGRTPQELLVANVEGTLLLCNEGRKAGVKKFVYASSIQVIASEYVPEEEPSYLPYLPLDGDCPANPRNPYAFSKATSEMLVRRLLPEFGIQCQSLRFPWLTAATADGDWGRRLQPHHVRECRSVREQCFTQLSFWDAARLVLACLLADLPGYRTYLPAITAIPPSEMERYLNRYYSGIPRRVPPKEIESLVDISKIEAETGWIPRDIPKPWMPEDLPGRIRKVMKGN
jgi:nucleoside-diphosphate-sugar epimerase